MPAPSLGLKKPCLLHPQILVTTMWTVPEEPAGGWETSWKRSQLSHLRWSWTHSWPEMRGEPDQEENSSADLRAINLSLLGHRVWRTCHATIANWYIRQSPYHLLSSVQESLNETIIPAQEHSTSVVLANKSMAKHLLFGFTGFYHGPTALPMLLDQEPQAPNDVIVNN